MKPRRNEMTVLKRESATRAKRRALQGVVKFDIPATARIAATALSCLLLLLAIPAARAGGSAPSPSAGQISLEVDSVGEQQTLLANGQHGLAYFPDEGISILHRDPLSFLMVAGDSTWLMQGASWAAAEPVRKVLAPTRDWPVVSERSEPNGPDRLDALPQGRPDNGYAGVGGVYVDPTGKQVFAFYHAEDHEGYPKLEYNGVPNFMASVCLAVAPSDSLQFERRGPVLTTHQAKNPQSRFPQGVGDVSVCPSADGQFLYAWYSDHSRVENRGVQICVARSAIADRGTPGSWKKWHNGAFDEPGLGGHETPVLSLAAEHADAFAPNVIYVPESHCYVMAFNATVYKDFDPAAKPAGGIRIACSADGIVWSKPVSLVTAYGVPVPGKQCAMHGTLVVSQATERSIEGSLLYAYSPSWGSTEKNPPHYLVSREVRLKVVADAPQ
jgi:hypothetical protein